MKKCQLIWLPRVVVVFALFAGPVGCGYGDRTYTEIHCEKMMAAYKVGDDFTFMGELAMLTEPQGDNVVDSNVTFWVERFNAAPDLSGEQLSARAQLFKACGASPWRFWG